MHTEIPIDEAGRVVIPKEVRDDWGLRSRGTLLLNHENGHVTLAPARPKGHLIKKGDMLVWSTGGATITQEEMNAVLDAARERRD